MWTAPSTPAWKCCAMPRRRGRKETGASRRTSMNTCRDSCPRHTYMIALRCLTLPWTIRRRLCYQEMNPTTTKCTPTITPPTLSTAATRSSELRRCPSFPVQAPSSWSPQYLEEPSAATASRRRDWLPQYYLIVIGILCPSRQGWCWEWSRTNSSDNISIFCMCPDSLGPSSSVGNGVDLFIFSLLPLVVSITCSYPSTLHFL